MRTKQRTSTGLVFVRKSGALMDDADMLTPSFLPFFPSAKVYIDKKLKRNSGRAPDDLIGDILHQSRLSKKELYAAITELQIGGVETVSIHFFFTSGEILNTRGRSWFLWDLGNVCLPPLA